MLGATKTFPIHVKMFLLKCDRRLWNVCEWLLDARLGDELELLFVDGDKRRIEKRRVSLQIYASYERWLEEFVDAHDLDMRVEEWLKPPLYRSPLPVAIIEVEPSLYRRVFKTLRSWVELWNTFPSPLQQVLWRSGLIPSSCDGDIPEPKYVRMGFRGWAGPPNVPSWRYIREVEVSINGDPITLGPREVGDVIESHSPHVIVLEGAKWRKLALSIPGVRSALKRGVLVDFLPLGITVRGLMEWSSLSHAPMRLASSYTIGKVLTSVEAFKAMERRYLVPNVAVRVERWKSVGELVRADRGGLILTPKAGIYWGVAQLDFDSFFPSIISQENISPETVNDPSCSDWFEVPGVGHRICRERRGLVSEAVSELVRRKRLYKSLGDSDRLEAIKWVLVACFGYLGYRNARFGSIESYESVTAMARHLAFRTMEVASNRGEVVHFLVDSLFVRTSDPHSLAEEIENELGYKIRVDSVYSWLVFFPPEEGGEFGVPSRYLGRLVGGGIKAKGLVRRDMPPLLRNLVERSLDLLGEAGDPSTLLSALMKIQRMFENAERSLMRYEVPEEFLVMEKRLDPPYSREISHWKAASLINASSRSIRYVEATFPYPVEMGRGGYDAQRYVDMVRRAYGPFDFLRSLLSNKRGLND